MKDIVKIDKVSFQYKGSSKGLLKDVSLSVKQGQTLLLCGASGSGKTTILRLINGLIPHYYLGDLKGAVNVAGFDIKNTQLYDLAGVVGTVFQNPRSQFFSVDTDGEIVFGPENIGLPAEDIKNRAADVIKDMNLYKLLGRSLFELSGGEKQKIACASVSALLPEIVLLDEPSSNLDVNAIKELKKAIEIWKTQGKTIIISEHRLWYLRDIVDRVIYMDSGSLKGDWEGKEFFALPDKTIRNLCLRPVNIEKKIIGNYLNIQDKESYEIKEDADFIELRDFFFSYKKKPYIFWRKKFDLADAKILSLNIPRLRLPRNAVIGVVGNNGTGKSTFLRCLCGLEKDCTGRVIINGIEYHGKKQLDISYMVMQDVNHQLFTDSVEAEVLLSMDKEDKERCNEILTQLGLDGLKDKHPMALSGGQKQRVAIASAMAAGAKILLFDEPTSGLDYLHMVKVAKMLKQLADSNKTVLVSTHDPELIKLCCDYVLHIDNGRAVGITLGSA
ncbi:ABC transporter ATP-binding protein [Butyrivibrio fibrisolvens]|uniref:ABC transporter ATP-binding protein n=1 Tax=Butyrivibrio fibrisolvens TaxID=831 RepID=UPI0004225D23|nr:ABC transporter ATP-binding protein [Butyrivibrio fibrisolvens]